MQLLMSFSQLQCLDVHKFCKDFDISHYSLYGVDKTLLCSSLLRKKNKSIYSHHRREDNGSSSSQLTLNTLSFKWLNCHFSIEFLHSTMSESINGNKRPGILLLLLLRCRRRHLLFTCAKLTVGGCISLLSLILLSFHSLTPFSTYTCSFTLSPSLTISFRLFPSPLFSVHFMSLSWKNPST